jgi:hypothetical protein
LKIARWILLDNEVLAFFARAEKDSVPLSIHLFDVVSLLPFGLALPSG